MKKVSKFLSFILRHKPDEIGLELDEEGWTSVDELIELANKNGNKLTREIIYEVVRTNDKQRFALSKDKNRIRANQGHSIDINLKLEPQIPPDTLYHGTATRFLDSIKEQGLKSASRQHVHLSFDKETATSVGTRHGKPIVLNVNSKQMYSDGIEFYRSENGVWLTQFVDSKYILFEDLV